MPSLMWFISFESHAFLVTRCFFHLIKHHHVYLECIILYLLCRIFSIYLFAMTDDIVHFNQMQFRSLKYAKLHCHRTIQSSLYT